MFTTKFRSSIVQRVVEDDRGTYRSHSPQRLARWIAFCRVQFGNVFAGVVGALWILASFSASSRSQTPFDCGNTGTAVLESDCSEDFSIAVELLLCVSNNLGSAEVLACVVQLGNAPEKVRVVSGGVTGSAYMMTNWETFTVDTNGNFVLSWTSSNSCTCILINENMCPYPANDPSCSAAIMAASLAHELCHAKTFAGTATQVGGVTTYHDPCGLAQNEVLCHCIELIFLASLASCVPPSCLPDLQTRSGIIHDSKSAWQNQLIVLGCN